MSDLEPPPTGTSAGSTTPPAGARKRPSEATSNSRLRSQVHDLRAPLNALSLNVELLRRSLLHEPDERPGVREERLSTTELLQREIERLERSLDLFLRRSSVPDPHAARLRRLDARLPVEDACRLLEDVASASGVEMRKSLPDSPLQVVADADLLEQALLNVLLNAIEAQPGGGRVDLRLEPAGPHARVVVEDDGPGIPEKLRALVFERNFTTKEGGTGIGLTVARSVIEAIRGRLRLGPARSRGTAIEILLERDGGVDERGCR